MKYAFFTDPSHGWLKVSIEEIKQLEITHRISAYSYISADRKYAYLEDMNAVRACTKNFYSDPPSFIRNLESFANYQLTLQPVVQSEIIFNF
jgi:hypothetical protein